MRRVLNAKTALTCVALAVPMVVSAEIVTQMTPERIQEAIAAGRDGVIFPRELYIRGANARRCAMIWTPFIRVADAALYAARSGRTFSASDVKPEMIAPQAGIVAEAFYTGYTTVRRVKALTIEIGSEVVQPISWERIEERYQLSSGARVTGTTMRGRFPLSALKPGSQVRVVSEDAIDCIAPIDIDGLR